MTPECTRRAAKLYESVVEEVHEVSSPESAELSKLLENVFRGVDIALVNELAILCHRMGIDVWEVVGAASTKPFGFMPFYPGPQRALHPHRPVLPLLARPGLRHKRRVHRAHGPYQREHALLCL